MKRLGVIGSMVWDTIYSRDPAQAAVEEWGGIAYALAALDVTLPDGWEIVPVIKVGRDLADSANQFLRSLQRTTPHARFVEVPAPNNRVTLRYQNSERRCERMAGGVPPWTWPELGPMVADLDALYVNFISGFELNRDTARLLRRGFSQVIYADLHSLFLGIEPDGMRVPQPLADAASWYDCFDYVQVNEEEMAQVGADPLAAAAGVLAQGVHALIVTLGSKGAVYFAGQPVRSARVAPPTDVPVPFDGGDPTGCGDVLGAAVVAGLVRGEPLEAALARATRLAARNVSHRGASGLRDHLAGRLSIV